MCGTNTDSHHCCAVHVLTVLGARPTFAYILPLNYYLFDLFGGKRAKQEKKYIEKNSRSRRKFQLMYMNEWHRDDDESINHEF